jgi:hypothetical protein
LEIATCTYFVVQSTRNRRLAASFFRHPGCHIGWTTTGGDAGFLYNLPGFGFIQELELLREAGFTPLEVIRAATQSGARALGHEDQVGTLKLGMKATSSRTVSSMTVSSCAMK